MLTNEQKALQQIVHYYCNKEYDKLQLYFGIIDSKYFLNQTNQRIFNSLKYLLLEKPKKDIFDLSKTQITIIDEILAYFKNNHSNEMIDAEEIAFLKEDISNEINLNVLDNLKHTYSQEKLFHQLIQTISPKHDIKDEYHKHLHYQEIFNKLRNFISLIPHENDKTLFSLGEMAQLHPELFAVDNSSKQKIQEEYYRMTETFKGLNQATKGFKKGQIITIGGFTGLGKTTFVYNLLLDIAKQQFEETKKYPHSLVFSYEMTLEENVSRLLSNFTKLPLNIIQDKDFHQTTPEEYLKLTNEAQEFFKKINLKFSYDKSKNINYVVDLVRRLHLEQKVEIVVIDHLQITKASNNTDNDRLAIDEIMTKLKELAIDLNIVIIILSQFSRDSYSNNKTNPNITSLKGSGGIETNSDIVLIMSEFQPMISKDVQKTYSHHSQEAADLYQKTHINEFQKIIEINIKKNRSGSKKILMYHFDMLIQTFREIGTIVSHEAGEL